MLIRNACIYVRIVEVEEYLDAKSDDTRDGIDLEKKILSVSPSKQRLLLGTERHDGKKKEKTVGSKSPKKRENFVFSPFFVGKGFCLL